MGRITEALIRKRAEHNEGMVSTLEEVALHQQNIERIEHLGQLCPHLKILYLQNNLISKIQNLHKLKELEYLNLAVNNITKIQNLQRCESLTKLDLTVNFVSKAGLLSVVTLQQNIHLKDLYLLGNPCTDWSGYRQFVIAKLPQLQKLDGDAIKHSERIAANQVIAQLEQQLREELRAEGIDPDKAAEVEDDSYLLENGELAETGYIDESGELKRPWCPATRILEHREMEKLNNAAEEQKKSAKTDLLSDTASKPTRHDDFPELKERERFYQRNEGKWDFSIEESEDSKSIVLEVAVGKYLDTSLIKADVQPTYIRLLIKGKLLQLLLPCEVKPDAATAQRSAASGRLQVLMPKENPDDRALDVSTVRPALGGKVATGQSDHTQPTAAHTKAAPAKKQHTNVYNIVKTPGAADDFVIKEVRKAIVQPLEKVKATAADDDDDDFIPPL